MKIFLCALAAVLTVPSPASASGITINIGGGNERSLCVCRESKGLFSGGNPRVLLEKYNRAEKTYEILMRVKGDTLPLQRKRCEQMIEKEPACFND